MLKIHLRRRVKSFVLLFTGRTGSTYLIDTLNSHPDIRAVGENLDALKEKGAAEQLKWTREFLTPPPIGRHAVRGFKTKLVDVLDRPGFAKLLRELNCSLLHLQRRNKVKAVISRIGAQRLYESTGDWNLWEERNRVSTLVVDPVEFDSYLQHRERVDQDLSSYVEEIGLPTLSLFYEDLLADPDAFLQRIFTFLEVEPYPVKGRVLKNTNDDLRSAVLNFDNLRSRYVGTVYEPMFDEVLVPVESGS